MNLAKSYISNVIKNRFINNLDKSNTICIHAILYHKKNEKHNCGSKDECIKCFTDQLSIQDMTCLIQKILKGSNVVRISSLKSLLGYCDNCWTKKCYVCNLSNKTRYISELEKLLAILLKLK